MSTAEERFYPEEFKLSFDSYIRHFNRYFESLKLLNKLGPNETWLDCASGSGYGTNLLSNFCKKIYGYDISEDAIKYSNSFYKKDNCDFILNLNELNEKSIDVIFSIETIEHMPKIDAYGFLKSFLKVLKDDGILIITTPIVKETNYSPTNKFHFLEYSDIDFKLLLEKNGFEIINTNFILTKFTDNEEKIQGFYKCIKK